MLFRKYRSYTFYLFVSFMLWGCGSGNEETIVDSEPGLYQSDYASYFSIPNDSSSDKDEYLSAVSDYLDAVPDALYSHQNVKWAVTFADKFMQEGYVANGQPALDITKEIPWGNVPDGDGNYTFKLNAMYMAEPLIFAYRKSGDEAYFDAALKIHLDWIKQNIQDGIENPYKWYDMATGLRTVQLTYLTYELLKRKSDPDIVKPLLQAIELHLTHLTNPEELGILNHVMFQMAGIYAVCNLLPTFNDCSSALSYADEQFKISISDQYNSDGIHTEHSPTYHTWGLEKIVALLSTGWFPEDIQTFVDRAKENIIWMYHPNGQMVMVGHSEQIPFERYEDYHDYVKYVLTEGAVGVQPPFNSKTFENSGYAIFRSPWTETPFYEHSFLFYNAGFHNLSHKTGDDLTFSWSEYGAPVIIDSGKYAYDRSDKRRYVESFRAHNTIEIVGKTAALKEEHIYGSAIDLSLYNQEKGLGFVASSVQRREANFSHQRNLAIRQKEWVYVNDVLAGSSNENIVQWFHLEPNAEIVHENSSDVTFWLPTQQKYLHIIDFTKSKSFTISKGVEAPVMQGWYSTTLFEFEPNYAVGLRSSGSSSEYKTLLLMSDSDEFTLGTIREFEDDNYAICWMLNGESDGFLVAEDDSLMTCSNSDVEVDSIELSLTGVSKGEANQLILEAKAVDGSYFMISPSDVVWEALPSSVQISDDGKLIANETGVFNLKFLYAGKSFEVELRVGLNYEDLYVPTYSAYNVDVWNAFKQSRELHIRNSAYENWKLPEQLLWNEDPYNSLSWQFIYQSTTWFHAFVYGYDNYNDDSGIEFAKHEIFNWWALNQNEQAYSTMAWHDHATANRVSEWLYLYNRFFIHSFTKQELETFEAIIEAHAAELTRLIDSGRWNGHNHSFYHSLALYSISKTFANNSNSDFWKNKALQQLDSLLSSMVNTEEGVSLEQSLAYHFNALYLFNEAKVLVDTLGDSLANLDNETILKMAEFGAYAKRPNQVLPALGDTNYGYLAGNWIINSMRDRGITSPSLEYIMTKGSSGSAPPFVMNYPQTGYHIFRNSYTPDDWDNDTHVFVDGAVSQRVHGNNDALSLTYYSKGVEVLVDSGAPYSYSQSLQQFRYEYFHHAKGHNTAIFNGLDYGDEDQFSLVKYGEEDEFGYSVLQRETELGEIHQRQVLVEKSGRLIVVDYFKFLDNSNVNLYWHVNPEATVSLNNIGNGITGYSASLDVQDRLFELDLVSTTPNTSCSIVTGRELEEPLGPMGWISNKLESKVAAPVLECTLSRPDKQYFWTITILGQGVDNEISFRNEDDTKIEFVVNGQTLKVTLNQAPLF